MPHKGHNLLRKGFATHTSSHETVQWWVNAINTGQKDGSHTPAAMLIWHMYMYTFSTSCMAAVAEMGILPANIFCILTEHFRKWKTCVKWIPLVLSSDQCVVHAAVCHQFPMLVKVQKCFP